MSETADPHFDPEAANRLQGALESLLGTFEGAATGDPHDVHPMHAAGIGRTMVDGAAHAGAPETAPPARTIEEDIAAGTSPWLAHIRHNRQDEEHPLIAGFCQDENGKLRPLYGNRRFQSIRQIPTDDPFQHHTNERSIGMLTSTFTAVPSASVVRGEHWDALPADLREHFERGEILVTAGADVYQQGTMPTAEDLANQESPYYLMYYYSRYGDGRTGVVMQAVNGELQPVTATVDGSEYILEVKGCGTYHGGFGESHNRTEREIITGGTEADQTVIELERLADERQPGAPKAVGGVLFENRDINVFGHPDGQYPQGYTIRLSPSTVRASYAGQDIYPPIDSPDMVQRVLDMYTAKFVEHMFGDPPKILNRSSHTENILLWGDGSYTFTDYSDHAAFADSHYPNGRVDFREMLLDYLHKVYEMPGMRLADKPGFYARLNEQFANQGVDIALQPGDDFETAAQKIWENCMAYQVYKARVGSGYSPDSYIEQHFEFFNSAMMTATDRSSADALAGSITAGREELLQAVDRIAALGVPTPSWPDHATLKDRIAGAPFSELSVIARQLRSDYEHGADHIPYDEGRSVREATGFYHSFRMLTSGAATDYFEHELDVLNNAIKSAPAEERDAILGVRDEVLRKRDYILSLADTDARALYDIVKDAESLRAFLRPTAYKAA